jgi:hypothetical protein
MKEWINPWSNLFYEYINYCDKLRWVESWSFILVENSYGANYANSTSVNYHFCYFCIFTYVSH